MPNWVLGVLLILVGLGGCSPRFVRVTRPEQFEVVLQKIALYNSKIKQLKAAVDIRGLGLFGNHFHERADLIVQKPHFFWWSLRSFFETPANVIASNGEFITMYDFTADRTHSYQELALKPQSVIDIFDFRFHPPSLIAILLAQVPLDGARNIQLRQHEDLIEWSADLSDAWQVRGLFDARMPKLLESSYTNQALGLFYHVRYSEHALEDGICFPKLYVMRAKGSSQALRFELRLTHSELNQTPMSPEIFYLRPR